MSAILQALRDNQQQPQSVLERLQGAKQAGPGAAFLIGQAFKPKTANREELVSLINQTPLGADRDNLVQQLIKLEKKQKPKVRRKRLKKK